MRIIRIDNKGWRARFDDGFDEESVSRVADAFGYIWADRFAGKTVYVGYDTRLNGRRFTEAAAGVLASYGLHVLVSDAPCPTPALGWSVAQDPDACGGVMLTASSESAEYGGISARGADGGPVGEDFYEASSRIMSSVPVGNRGVFQRVDLVGPYLKDLASMVDAKAIADARLEIVVDPMYGSGRGYLAQLLRSLGCRVHELHGEEHADFDGLRPLVQEPWVNQCAQAVRSFGCDLGILLDGDADRMGIVDERGQYLTPHVSGPLIMEHMVANRGENGRVVTTFSSSALIMRQAWRLGLDFTEVPMGFTRIYREFTDGDVMMGLEGMGGICRPSHLPERDGIMAALLVVEYKAMSDKTVSEMVADLAQEIGTMTYVERDIELDASSIQAFRNILPGINLQEVCGMQPESVGHADGLVLRFADDSWVQLRPTRTEALVRARAESPDPRLAEALGEQACREALKRLPAGPWKIN